MCGLNFLIDKTGRADNHVIEAMNAATKHRGPDHTSVLIREKYNMKFLMGVNRLCIVDDNPESDQPFSTHPEYYLLYNGELYNHLEIRDDLMEKGIQFKTLSDTETLYYFLIEYGKEALQQLNGMFSFVFVDLIQDEITIARDPWGMKPIYYYIDENFMIISSEVKGILASGYVKKIFNSEEIPHYLYYKYVSPGNTFYKNIFQLRNGCYHTLDIKSDKLKKESFRTTLNQDCTDTDKTVLVDTVEKLISKSIDIHTRANVPVGLFLSGGIDSTLLLALSYESQNQIPYCFSISNKPSERQYGTADYQYIQLAADRFKCDTVNIEVDDKIFEYLDEMIVGSDQPIADGAMLLTFLLSREAKKKVGVVLSGAGGDELFAGYNRHWAFYYYLKNYKILELLKRPYSIISHFSTIGSGNTFRKKKRLIDRFIKNIDPNPETTFNNFLGLQNIGNYIYQKSMSQNIPPVQDR